MAGQRLTDRTALAGADFANDDLVLVFDLSANTTKKMTRAELLTSISGVLPNGDKGDITVSGSGTTWTIDNNVVTYAKMQDVSAQYRLLGRSSSGAGDVEEITSSANVFSILGAADYASVRTLLSLVPGTDVQSYSAILAAFAGAAAASDKLPYFTGASTVGVTDFTSFGRSLVDDANASAARTTLGLVIGTDVQAYSANTAAIAALTHGYGNVIVSNGTSWFSEPLDTYNAIINGDFDIWQRGTSFSSIANDTYFADRWRYVKNTSGVHDVSRSTDVPTVAQAGRLLNYSALLDCTTADASIASGEVHYLHQKIEGFMFLPLAQRTFTLSFWVKGTKTGIYCVAFRNSGLDRSYVAEYTISAADTWEFKTVTVTASPSAGTWDYATGIGLTIDFSLACGSSSTTTAGTWQTGNFLATSNQVNALDSTSNNFRITGVRLVAGSVAKPLIQRPYAQELALCQRYYEKSFQMTQAPATNTGSANDTHYLSQPVGASTFFYATPSLFFRATKRTNPTVTIFNTAAANNQIRNYSRVADCTSSGVSSVTQNGFMAQATSVAGSAAGDLIGFAWTAEAEL